MNRIVQKPLRRSKEFWLGWTLVAILLAAVIGPVYYVGSSALQAEIELLDGVTAFQEMAEFVKKHHRWPHSWEELEAKPPPEGVNHEALMAQWARIRQHVQIDFEIDPKKIGSEDPKNFYAVKPIARNYDYDGLIMALQFEVRNSIPDAGDK